MYLQLMYRHNGVQRAVKSVWVPCGFDLLFSNGFIDETLLLNLIPAGWLPAAPGEILLTAAHPRGSQGLKNLSIFKPWGRHFDCYVLELWREEPHG